MRRRWLFQRHWSSGSALRGERHQGTLRWGVIVPSGVDATTGETPGVHVSADRTLTLALPKTGLVGPSVGELWLADIGIPAEVYRRLGIPVSSQIFDSGFLVRLRS